MGTRCDLDLDLWPWPSKVRPRSYFSTKTLLTQFQICGMHLMAAWLQYLHINFQHNRISRFDVIYVWKQQNYPIMNKMAIFLLIKVEYLRCSSIYSRVFSTIQKCMTLFKTWHKNQGHILKVKVNNWLWIFFRPFMVCTERMMIERGG